MSEVELWLRQCAHALKQLPCKHHSLCCVADFLWWSFQLHKRHYCIFSTRRCSSAKPIQCSISHLTLSILFLLLLSGLIIGRVVLDRFVDVEAHLSCSLIEVMIVELVFSASSCWKRLMADWSNRSLFVISRVRMNLPLNLRSPRLIAAPGDQLVLALCSFLFLLPFCVFSCTWAHMNTSYDLSYTH